MNVIRMLKLFGWEKRIAAQMDEKRHAELIAVRRNRILGVSNAMFKYVIHSTDEREYTILEYQACQSCRRN